VAVKNESKEKKKESIIPSWWSVWWETYQAIFPQYDEESAIAKILEIGFPLEKTMIECQDKIIEILSN
jgi:hypothetical protein